MSSPAPFSNLLVPVDFSDASHDVFRRALTLVDGDEPLIIVLHVVDETMVDLLTANGFGQRDDVVHRLRERAETQLQAYAARDREGLQVDHIVSVGLPFLEIIRKAEDFAVDAIIMGKVGTSNGFERLLFGSTAERVIRGSQRPVVVLPIAAKRTDADDD
jgi:nucleotide-binding universal stress UspA family protein